MYLGSQKCTLDIGRGEQKEFAKEVNKWAAFHDSLKDSNSNKSDENQWGLILHTQLFGMAADLTRHLSIEDLREEDGVYTIVNCIYKNDSLTIMCEVHKDFSALLNSKHANNESVQNFESRFAAQLARLNAHGD